MPGRERPDGEFLNVRKIRLTAKRCCRYRVSTSHIDSTVWSRPPFGAVSVFLAETELIPNLYIDGFNLYYRALKETLFRWLDLCRRVSTAPVT